MQELKDIGLGLGLVLVSENIDTYILANVMMRCKCLQAQCSMKIVIYFYPRSCAIGLAHHTPANKDSMCRLVEVVY